MSAAKRTAKLKAAHIHPGTAEVSLDMHSAIRSLYLGVATSSAALRKMARLPPGVTASQSPSAAAAHATAASQSASVAEGNDHTVSPDAAVHSARSVRNELELGNGVDARLLTLNVERCWDASHSLPATKSVLSDILSRRKLVV